MSLICAGGFLVLFPGFFFYHTLIGLGLIPAILGGFFRPMSLLFMAVALPVILLSSKPKSGRSGACGTLYLCILCWTAIVAMWHYMNGTQVGNIEMLDWSLSGVLLGATCYTLARYLPFDWSSFNMAVVVSLALMVVLVFMLAKDGMFNIRAEGLADDEKIATYQGFGRSLATTALLAVALVRTVSLRVAISVSTVAALYINGARSEFVCLIAALLFLWGAASVANQKSAIPLVTLVLFVLLLPLFSIEAVLTMIPENRVLQLLDLAGSTSAIGRAELSQAGWEQIETNPVFGNYGFYYDTGGVGSYPHNISAAWVNLGIIGILGYFVLFGALIIVQVMLLKRGPLNKPSRVAALLFLSFTVVALLFAKEYSYMLTAFAVAFAERSLTEITHEAQATIEPV